MRRRTGPHRSPEPPSTASNADLLRYGARLFRRARLVFGHGTAAAEAEAEYLLAHALGARPPLGPATLKKAPSSRRRARALQLFARRIAERRPAAYLAREAWLDGQRFYVDERVIIPRSHLAGLIGERFAPWVRDPARIRTVLDLCTGGGSLAILLARRFPGARIEAADISPAALAVARRNVIRHGMSRRIRLVRSDLFSRLRGRRYDLVVANPPYVTSAAMRRLPAEYRHEPPLALAAGADGLHFAKRILREARKHLAAGGLLAMEVGRGRYRIEKALPRAGFIWPEVPAGHPVLLAFREQLTDRALSAGASRKPRG